MATKTDDPTKRYTDSELDPSRRAFDDLVGNYDKTADPSAENDNIQKLRDAENAPTDFDERDGKDEARRKEAEEWNDPANRFGYKPNDDKQKTPSSPTRRRNAIRLGVAGGIIGLLVPLFGMLMPLKIPGIMSMISKEAGQRVEQITEHRAKIIIARYMLQGSGLVVTGDGPVSTLFATMRTKNFEKKLAAKGITIEGTGKSTTVRFKKEAIFTLGDQEIGKGTITLVQKLDGTTAGRQAMKELVKEEIPSWRFMKRAKFAKWLRIKYGIPKYGIENSQNPDSEEAIKEMERDRLTNEIHLSTSNSTEFLDCISSAGEECLLDMDNEENTKPGGHKDSNNSDDVSSVLEDSNTEAVDEILDDPDTDRSKIMSDILSKKFASKAIPVIGWIDLAATINHAIKEEAENDFLGKAVAGLKEKNYAQLNGMWSGYGSQIQLGAMRPDYISALAKQTEGVEEAQAFQMIEGNYGKSNLAVLGDTAYALTPSDIPGVPVDKINSNKTGLVKEKIDAFNDATGGGAKLAGKPTSVVLEGWYNTLGEGGILGKVGELLSTAALTLTPDAVKDWAGELLTMLWDKILELFGLDYNPFVTGAKWFNNAHGGATAAYNRFCKVIGCRQLSTAQASLQNQQIASERAEYLREKGVLYAMFSPEETTSLPTQLAINTSGDMATNLSNLASFVFSAPAMLVNQGTTKSSAANPYIDLYGVDPYGATDADLNQPVSPEAISGEACPEVAEGDYDNCAVDTITAEAMLCEFEPETEECGNDDSDATNSDAAAFDFTVASYNILHSTSHTEKSMSLGGCNNNPVPGDPTCAKTRGARQVKIITGQLGNPAFDLFGTQETAPEQYDYLKQNLPGYAAFPESTERMNNADDGAVAVFWNTSKFTMFENGKAPGKSNTMKDITNPWVGLRTTSGQNVYVMSIHYATSTFGGTPAGIRESSQLTLDWVKSKATGDNIVIVMGDFNDHLTNGDTEPHYCMYTKDSLMQHAVDMSADANLAEGCSKKRYGGIDQIYATPVLDLEASGWKSMQDTGEVAKASDHVPVYATYTIPGAETLTGGGSFTAGTYNLLNADVHADTSRSIGGPYCKAGDPACVKGRSALQAKIILGETDSYPKIDLVGLQETTPAQYRELLRNLPTYDGVPSKDSDINKMQQKGNGTVGVVWDTSIFTKFDEGFYATISNVNTNISSPWVGLQDSSGNKFYVFSNHFPTEEQGGGPAVLRKGTDLALDFAREMEGAGGVPIILGDFNDHTPEKKTYCWFTESGSLQNSHDMALGEPVTKPCPNPVPDFDIDHIYLSTKHELTAANWKHLPRHKNASAAQRATHTEVYHASDHSPMTVTVTLPGTTTTAAGAWAFPVKAAAWQTDGQRWLEPHTSSSDAWTNGLKAAADVNIGSGNSDCSEPVYAMIGGTIKSNPPAYTMQVVSSVNGKDIVITYAHGKNMKTSGVVQAGDKIMEISNNSKYGGSCHLHLEILNGSDAICPQKVFPLIAAKSPVDLTRLPKATSLCAG